MRHKSRKEEALRQDLLKYCKQIGIIDCEIPLLVFRGEDYRQALWDTNEKYGHSHHAGGKGTRYGGYCSNYARVIFVNLRFRRDATLRVLRRDLVHELIHYRFEHLGHDRFEQRIDFILKGKVYPKKHLQYPRVPMI